MIVNIKLRQVLLMVKLPLPILLELLLLLLLLSLLIFFCPPVCAAVSRQEQQIQELQHLYESHFHLTFMFYFSFHSLHFDF